MNQISKLISALSVRQRITIVAVAALIISGFYYFSHWRTESDFHPIYTSLSPEDAAAIVQKMKETGSPYRLSEDGATVLAPSARVAELRLEMASSGLPKSGRIGFELFDKNNLGVTEFAEHVNYARALEGEIERSITSLTEIQQARVHLTFPKDSVFLESKQPGKASVVLHMRPGAKLSAQNVNAITNLVASAVEGLSPENITLVDSHGALLSRPRKSLSEDGSQASEASIEYRQKIESDLLAKINTTLEPLLGSDKFRAGVSVDCDFTSGEQSEETVDPNKSVMLSSQKTEESTGSPLNAGAPGTAANLPRPPTPSKSGSNSVNRKTENIAFQTSRLVKHTRMPQGTVKRVSISVLIDNDLKWEGTPKNPRRVLIPPSAERLKSIRDIVTGVAGLRTDRGDQIVVEALPFEATLSAEPPVTAPPVPAGPDPRFPKWMQPLVTDPKNMIIAIAAAVAVPILMVIVLFLMRKKKPKTMAPDVPTAIPGSAGATASQPALANQQAEEQAKLEVEEFVSPQFKLPKETTKKSEFLIKHINDTVVKDNPSMMNVLRTWISQTTLPEKDTE
jgi:flagellar M-ring protein FliF